MDKCTQNLVNDVINTVLENVNTAICFYMKRPTVNMRLSLEESVIDNMPFAKLAAQQSEHGKLLVEKLNELNSTLVEHLPIFPIKLGK